MNNPTNCKECHKLAISNSLSILFPYLKMLLKKFGKKHNKKVLNFNIESLIRKYRLLDGKCEISGIVMEHIVKRINQMMILKMKMKLKIKYIKNVKNVEKQQNYDVIRIKREFLNIIS